MKTRIRIMPIKDITWDLSVYPREHYNFFVVANYSRALKSGAKFPPIAVAKLGKRYLLVDGKHRIEANKLQKNTHIKTQILTGLNKNEIYAEAVRRNITHGKELTSYDKTRIIVRLKEIGYDLPKISSIICMPITSMEKLIVSKVTSSITGEPIVLKRSLKHLKGREIKETREEFEDTQRMFHGNTQTELLDQLINLINLDYIDTKNVNVLQRLKMVYSQIGRILKKKK